MVSSSDVARSLIAITSVVATFGAGCAREVAAGSGSVAPAVSAAPAHSETAQGDTSAGTTTPEPAAAPPISSGKPDGRDPTTPQFGRTIGGGTGEIAAVYAVARTGDERGPADLSPRRARTDQRALLYAVVVVADGAHRRYYSDAGAIRIGGKTHDTAPLADGPPVELAWMRVEPTTKEMSNTASGSFRYEPIPYGETSLVADDGVGAQLAADVRPTLTPNHGDAAAPGIGTMRYRLYARDGAGRIVSTPGAEARRGGASGGLRDDVLRVSLRRDDTYLGYLTEMYGQPYIWASAGPSPARHQSERLEGSDCADFIVYGARRLGKDIPYTWTGSLPSYTRRLGKGALRDDGVYVDADGAPLPFPRAGDLILFPRHVGALVEDRGTPGVLDTADLMMHTLFDSPKEEAIATSGYAETAVELHRFRP